MARDQRSAGHATGRVSRAHIAERDGLAMLGVLLIVAGVLGILTRCRPIIPPDPAPGDADAQPIPVTDPIGACRAA